MANQANWITQKLHTDTMSCVCVRVRYVRRFVWTTKISGSLISKNWRSTSNYGCRHRRCHNNAWLSTRLNHEQNFMRTSLHFGVRHRSFSSFLIWFSILLASCVETPNSYTHLIVIAAPHHTKYKHIEWLESKLVSQHVILLGDWHRSTQMYVFSHSFTSNENTTKWILQFCNLHRPLSNVGQHVALLYIPTAGRKIYFRLCDSFLLSINGRSK